MATRMEASFFLRNAFEGDSSGETHLRHHITADGYYRGKKVLNKVEEIPEVEA
jgi:large subunit ribosomal protein L32